MRYVVANERIQRVQLSGMQREWAENAHRIYHTSEMVCVMNVAIFAAISFSTEIDFNTGYTCYYPLYRLHSSHFPANNMNSVELLNQSQF